MKVIYKGRAMGKTTEICKETIKNNGYLLVVDEVNKRLIEELYPELKGKVLNWKTLPISLLGRKIDKLYIDNADYLLCELLKQNIVGVTINKENKNENND